MKSPPCDKCKKKTYTTTSMTAGVVLVVCESCGHIKRVGVPVPDICTHGFRLQVAQYEGQYAN